jgi:hypothetical protein
MQTLTFSHPTAPRLQHKQIASPTSGIMPAGAWSRGAGVLEAKT